MFIVVRMFGMTHELLLHTNRSSYRVEPGPVCVPQCVRSETTDAGGFGSSLILAPHLIVGPGEVPACTGDAKIQSSCPENSVVCFHACRAASNSRSNDESLARLGCLYIVHILADDASLDRELTVNPVHVSPSKRKAFADTKARAAAEQGHQSKRLLKVLNELLEFLLPSLVPHNCSLIRVDRFKDLMMRTTLRSSTTAPVGSTLSLQTEIRCLFGVPFRQHTAAITLAEMFIERSYRFRTSRGISEGPN